jgi:hypothetical protein
MAYYLDYLHFQIIITMDIDKVLEIKTFNECNVAQTDSYINYATNNTIYISIILYSTITLSLLFYYNYHILFLSMHRFGKSQSVGRVR